MFRSSPASSDASPGDAPASAPAAASYDEAMQRVLENLDIAGEQRQGKLISAEMLLVNSDFRYDPEADDLVLDQLPESYCLLSSLKIPVGNVLAYQEPGVQLKRDRYLFIPRRPGAGSRSAEPAPGRDSLPANTRIIDLLGEAFTGAGITPPHFSVNIRRWGRGNFDRNISRVLDSPYFGGFFFEGGSSILSQQRRGGARLDSFVEGMSWVLANTQSPIFVLMPGYWERGEADSEEEIDGLIDRVRSTVLQLDQRVGERLGLEAGEHAVCNGRIHLIPASYGAPIHMQTLPPRRDGHLAGTVTGQIELLAEMRDELCGAAE